MKLKEYIDKLNQLIEDYPKALGMEVIYSHDDEGNEYQKLWASPTLCQVEDIKTSRFIEIVGFNGDEDILIEYCNAVCIN